MNKLILAFCAVCALVVASAQPVSAQQYVVVVLDDSGSMGDTMRTEQGRRARRIEVAKNALIQVLTALPADTQVGVVALNSRLGNSPWIIPFGTGNANAWSNNIQQIKAQGGTPLGEFLKVGADRLLELRQQNRYGTFRLLVVTDGEATDEYLLSSYLPDVLSRGLMVDVIGVDMQGDHSLATRVHSYRRAEDDASLQQALSQVFAESSSDNQDAEADFEMLAALPDEFAEGALRALAKRGNQPIEEVEINETSGFSTRTRPQGSGGSGAAPFATGGLFCCLVGMVFSVVVVSLILAGRKRGRRR